MKELKQLAEKQGGTIKIEQLEKWLSNVIVKLEEEKEMSYADFDKYVNDYELDLDDEYDDWYHKGIARAIQVLKERRGW